LAGRDTDELVEILVQKYPPRCTRSLSALWLARKDGSKSGAVSARGSVALASGNSQEPARRTYKRGALVLRRSRGK
jgi:hypothetical protein